MDVKCHTKMMDGPDVPDPKIRAAAESFPLLDIGGDMVVQLREQQGAKGGFMSNSRRAVGSKQHLIHFF